MKTSSTSGATSDFSYAALDRPGASPSPVVPFRALDRVLTLFDGVEDSQKNVLEALDHGLTSTTGGNVRRFDPSLFVPAFAPIGARATSSQLETAFGFDALPFTVQEQMRNELRLRPGLLISFTDLAGDRDFQKLPPSVQSLTISELTKHSPSGRAANDSFTNLGDQVKDAKIQATLVKLTTHGAFALLSEAEQLRLVKLIGGENKFLSEPARAGLEQVFGYFETVGDDATRARLLSTFASDPQSPFFAFDNATNYPEALYAITRGIPSQSSQFDKTTGPAIVQDVIIDGQKIKVILAEPPHPQAPTIDDVARALASLPPSARALVNEIVVEAQPNGGTMMGNAGNGRMIVFPVGLTAERMGKVMVHEAGHFLSDLKLGDFNVDPRWDPWKAAIKADGVRPSTYSKNNITEDFAEATAIYRNVRGTPLEAEMRALMPERFKILDELIG